MLLPGVLGLGAWPASVQLGPVSSTPRREVARPGVLSQPAPRSPQRRWRLQAHSRGPPAPSLRQRPRGANCGSRGGGDPPPLRAEPQAGRRDQSLPAPLCTGSAGLEARAGRAGWGTLPSHSEFRDHSRDHTTPPNPRRVDCLESRQVGTLVSPTVPLGVGASQFLEASTPSPREPRGPRHLGNQSPPTPAKALEALPNKLCPATKKGMTFNFSSWALGIWGLSWSPCKKVASFIIS